MQNGSCGKNLTWQLDDEGTLTIRGTGDMDKRLYYEGDRGYPWRHSDSLKKLSSKMVLHLSVTEHLNFVGTSQTSNCLSVFWRLHFVLSVIARI